MTDKLTPNEIERCQGRYPVPGKRDEPFEVTYRCSLTVGHEGPCGALLSLDQPRQGGEVTERLEAIHEALDDALGDTDITHIESDDELREQYPVQWAATQLAILLRTLPAAPAQPERNAVIEALERLTNIAEHVASEISWEPPESGGDSLAWQHGIDLGEAIKHARAALAAEQPERKDQP